MIHAIVDQYSHCEWVENSMSANENNLIWIDLEMTGLDPERDRIIEIATLVTDANLNILAEGPTIRFKLKNGIQEIYFIPFFFGQEQILSGSPCLDVKYYRSFLKKNLKYF